MQVIYNLNLASAKAIALCHEMCDAKIGNILNLTPAYPATDSKEDQETSKIVDAFYNRSFLEPAVHGHFPQEMIDIMKENDVLWDQTEKN